MVPSRPLYLHCFSLLPKIAQASYYNLTESKKVNVGRELREVFSLAPLGFFLPLNFLKGKKVHLYVPVTKYTNMHLYSRHGEATASSCFHPHLDVRVWSEQ